MNFRFVVLGLFICFTLSAIAQREEMLTIDQFMTADELKGTGVSTLSQVQRKELDRWLTHYTYALLVEKCSAPL